MPEWNDGTPPLVQQIIKDHMIAKAMDNPRRYDIFHPSAWGQCPRKVAYQWYNEKEPFWKKSKEDIDFRLERIFDNGHGTHARWQAYLDGAGVLRGYWRCPNPLCGAVHGTSERIGIYNPLKTTPGWKCHCGNGKKLIYDEVLVKSPPEYNFEGHCDAVVDLRGTPYFAEKRVNLFIVDLKTMKDEMYADLEKSKSEHVVQVHIYMWLLDIPGAVVVYENKDNQELKEMFVPRDEALIEDIKKQAVWLRGLLHRNQLPKRPSSFSRSAFPCRLCEFQRICWDSSTGA